MKVKHILSTISLSIALGLGIFAGIALNKGEVKEAKADAGDTWMFAAYFDASTIPDSYRDQCSNFRFHVWGTNVDEVFTMHESGAEDLYTVNCAFTDEQAVAGGQFIFYQAGDQNADKTSTDASFTYNKDSDFFGHMSWKFKEDTSWPDGKWELTAQAWGRAMYYFYNSDGSAQISGDFAIEPEKNQFALRNVIVTEENLNKTFDVLVRNQWNDGYDIIYNEDMTKTGSAGWFNFKEVGTYDLIVHNECKTDGTQKGILEIIKHENVERDIFLVGIEPDAYIYTFGRNGNGEFGAFPGKKLSEVVNMYSRADIELSDIKFEAADVNILMLVNVKMGYPNADHIIISYLNEYGVVGNQTADMLLSPGSAYWFSNDANYHNDDAGAALEFLRQAKGYLDNPGVDGSVCNLSSNNAKEIVNMYNALTDDVRYYVDRTAYNTFKRDGSSGKEDVNFRIVMEQISEIANIALVGSNKFNTLSNINSSIIAIIVAVSAVSAISIIAFVVMRKKRLD